PARARRGPSRATGQGAAAVDTLAGRVVDRDGQGLADATVLVAELHRVTITGPDGAFRFPAVPPGRYTVVVRRVGYAARVREVEVGMGPAELTLVAAAVQVEPVTVTATRQPIAALGSSLHVSGLSGTRLRRAQSVSLGRGLGVRAQRSRGVGGHEQRRARRSAPGGGSERPARVARDRDRAPRGRPSHPRGRARQHGLRRPERRSCGGVAWVPGWRRVAL